MVGEEEEETEEEVVVMAKVEVEETQMNLQLLEFSLSNAVNTSSCITQQCGHGYRGRR